MAPDSSLLGTGLKKGSCLWLTYVYLSYPAWLHHLVYIQI
jgi:hypothetical protein